MSSPDDIRLPLNQVAFAVLDLRRTEAWWREGLGFLPAGGNRLLFRPPFSDGKLQKLPGSAMTCWCMVGRSAWAQLEFFQYERPMSKLMPDDYRACDQGYSRLGIWVADFDRALAQLAAHDGTLPLATPVGAKGQRRACVRNPDGVYVELMEDDPLPEQNSRGRMACPAAIRYATLSTPDLQKSATFLTQGLGMSPSKIALHGDEHEAIWGLAGAQCERQVFVDGSGQATMLLELVQYRAPLGQPLPKDYRLCDQRILNVCFGDPKRVAGVRAMHRRALAAGATETAKPLNLGLVGCVYVDDPLGFSYEFMFASGKRMHKAFGFLPAGVNERPQLDNRRIESDVLVPAAPATVFAVLGDHARLGEWAGLGTCRLDQPGTQEANGRGAERVIGTSLGDIREQITEWRPNQGYRYRVIEGGPLLGHWGEVKLIPEGKSTRVIWSVRFRSRVPGLGGVLGRALQCKLDAALCRLAGHCTSMSAVPTAPTLRDNRTRGLS